MANTVTVAIDAADIAALAARIERSVDDVQVAATAAAHATAGWLKARVGDDLVAATGIAQTLFERRVRKYVKSGVDARGRVFVGLFRPEASLANFMNMDSPDVGTGALVRRADGAQAGKHFFKGAFVAKMPNGFVGIFRRNGKFGRNGKAGLERISVEHVDLPSAADLIARHELPAEVYFRREFDRRVGALLA